MLCTGINPGDIGKERVGKGKEEKEKRECKKKKGGRKGQGKEVGEGRSPTFYNLTTGDMGYSSGVNVSVILGRFSVISPSLGCPTVNCFMPY